MLTQLKKYIQLLRDINWLQTFYIYQLHTSDKSTSCRVMNRMDLRISKTANIRLLPHTNLELNKLKTNILPPPPYILLIINTLANILNYIWEKTAHWKSVGMYRFLKVQFCKYTKTQSYQLATTHT